jgi:N-formylglutamate amidohydrolase
MFWVDDRDGLPVCLPASPLNAMFSCPQVVHAPLSIEAGTLTRTMKPRRAAIQKSYDADVAALLARLR